MDANTPDQESKNRIVAVTKTFRIVRALHELGTCRISDLNAELDIPKSTIDVHVQTLHDLEYVTRTDDGEYRLSLRFLEHGGKVRKQRDIYHVARQEIDDLSEETGEVATLGYEKGGQRVLLYRSEPTDGISDNAPVGQFTNMHWTAVGKALLAQKSNATIKSIVEKHGLPRATDSTVTDLDSLLEEIATIRERGYSIEAEEHIEGIKSVAVPLEDLESSTSAISVAGPKRRFSQDRIEGELVEKLQNTENVIGLKCKHY